MHLVESEKTESSCVALPPRWSSGVINTCQRASSIGSTSHKRLTDEVMIRSCGLIDVDFSF